MENHGDIDIVHFLFVNKPPPRILRGGVANPASPIIIGHAARRVIIHPEMSG